VTEIPVLLQNNQRLNPGREETRRRFSLLDANFRGIPLPELIYLLQDYEDKRLELEAFPTDYLNSERWIEVLDQEIAGIQREILRRRTIPLIPRPQNDRELIETIKSRVNIADILEMYTQVLYSTRAQMRYRCNLHGDGNDREPAGIIYVNENRFWCFVCNRGGDCFDAVQQFEHSDLPAAISKLARYIGLEARPIVPKPKSQRLEVEL